jgi:hypothetical protein
MLIALAISAVIAACGSSSTSSAKPAYCSSASALKKSISNLPTAITGGASSLEAQLRTVESQVTAAVSSAKGDFPQETQAMSNALAELKKTVQGLPASGPSASQLATLATQGTAAVTAIQAFVNATHSKCA